MHDRRTVYLLIRAYNDWHVQSLESVVCSLEDAKAPLAAPVYDLPLDYEGLDDLNDILHSNQLGDVAVQLHNDEVDFSNNTRGISGALQGTACDEHDWFVQEDPEVNCQKEKFHVTCKKKRYTTLNVVEFSNMKLHHGRRYFICVHAWGGSCSSSPIKMCSNGFIIDTKPPLPGHIYIGHGNQEVRGHADNTSMLIRWEGFEDIETELELPYASGIKEYYYAIGECKILSLESIIAYDRI